MAHDSPGEILGVWRIVRSLGRGGMGEVFEAENTLSGTRRALKRIRPELLGSSDNRERFLREVSLSQRVRHPNVVECLDPFLVDGAVILPMELLRGRTLAARLSEGAMTVQEAVELVLALARGAGALHSVNLVHRDLKPGNVFLARDADGRVVPKILDLGATHDVQAERVTKAGFVVGTLSYMAPEQVRGEARLDARVDVYALGVLLYICLTGKRPVENDDSGNVLEKLARGDRIAPPSSLGTDVPRAVEAILMRALSPEREDRHADGNALAEALSACGEVPSVGAPFAELTSQDEVLLAPRREEPRELEAPEHEGPALNLDLDPHALRGSRPMPAPAPAQPAPAQQSLPTRGVWSGVAGLTLTLASVWFLGFTRTFVLAALVAVAITGWRWLRRTRGSA